MISPRQNPKKILQKYRQQVQDYYQDCLKYEDNSNKKDKLYKRSIDLLVDVSKKKRPDVEIRTVEVPKIIENIIEVPKIVEKEVIKEVPVIKEIPKEVIKEIIKEVEVPVEKIVEKKVEVPVEKIVTKEVIKEVPKEVVKVKEVIKVKRVPVKRIVEKVVEKEVPIPCNHEEQIISLAEKIKLLKLGRRADRKRYEAAIAEGRILRDQLISKPKKEFIFVKKSSKFSATYIYLSIIYILSNLLWTLI